MEDHLSIGLIVLLLVLLYIPLRNLTLIYRGYRQHEPKRARNAGVIFLFFVAAYLVVTAFLLVSTEYEAPTPLVMFLLAITGIAAGYLSGSDFFLYARPDKNREINTVDDFRNYYSVELDYNEIQLFRNEHYEELAEKLDQKVRRGKWLLPVAGMLLFVGALAAIGYAYHTADTIPYTIGIAVILGPAVIALQRQRERCLRIAAEKVGRMSRLS